jgi:hypothetical protein
LRGREVWYNQFDRRGSNEVRINLVRGRQMKDQRLANSLWSKAAMLALVGLIVLMTTDCVVWPEMGPPALRAEVIVARPGPAYVWIAGYWGWRAGGYYWVPGRWVRERPGRAWVPGRWERIGRHWEWRRGYWR